MIDFLPFYFLLLDVILNIHTFSMNKLIISNQINVIAKIKSASKICAHNQ